MSRVLLARQPVYNRKLEVVAYELLYRGSDEAKGAHFIDGNQASATVLINSFTELGVTRITGGLPAYVNFTHELLVGGQLPDCLKSSVVVEILESVQISDELIHAVRRLKADGFRIALDDFEAADEWDPLLMLADVIKLDVMALGMERTAELVARLRSYPARLLAEKVETEEELVQCRELGFDYFQGYFLSRPDNVRSDSMPIFASQHLVLELLAELQDPDISIERVASYLVQDVRLSYRLLRVVNSVYYNLPSPIESIERAIMYLGLNELRNWISLLALSKLNERPTEVLKTAMIRARMCYYLAPQALDEEQASYFAAGLLSILPAIMNRNMADILSKLHLSEDINRALLAFEGSIGETLEVVLRYERADWNAIELSAFNQAQLLQAYVDSIEWTNGLASAMMRDDVADDS